MIKRALVLLIAMPHLPTLESFLTPWIQPLIRLAPLVVDFAIPPSPSLMQLGLGFNHIESVSVASCTNLSSLVSLDLSYNKIESLSLLLSSLANLPGLRHLSLAGNPCALLPLYRSRVLSALPNLTLLDDVPVHSASSTDVATDALSKSDPEKVRACES